MSLDIYIDGAKDVNITYNYGGIYWTMVQLGVMPDGKGDLSGSMLGFIDGMTVADARLALGESIYWLAGVYNLGVELEDESFLTAKDGWSPSVYNCLAALIRLKASLTRGNQDAIIETWR